MTNYSNNYMKKVLLLPLFTLVLAGYSCQKAPTDSNQNKTNLANPASVYCQEQGGRVDIRTDANGNQTGFCIFTDNSECEEWSYVRGECLPQSQAENISEQIKQLFVQKYKKDPSEVRVTINQQTTNYARGGVKFGRDGIGEGGIFLAAKVDGEWKLVFDGNGIISCALLKPYQFPTSMIPDCFE